MSCQNTNNITLRFPKIGLEIRPYTVDFRIDRTELDYLDAKFSKETGEYLTPYTETQNALLRDPQPVQVVMDGEVTHRLYFRPDYVTYGETNCWIELHDPQKHLSTSIIDDKFTRVTAKNAYRRVFEGRNKRDVLTDIEFKIPPSSTSNLDEAAPTGPGGVPLIPTAIPLEFYERNYNRLTALWKDYDEEASNETTQNVLDSQYNFDVKNKTSLEALYHLNNKLGLSSWVDREGTLVIGLDFMDSSHHVASDNDSRVWRYNDAEMTPPGSPVKMAIVNGGMIDAPNKTQEEGALESLVEFTWPTSKHEEDLVPQGVAQRPSVLDGKVVSITEPNLSRDALEARAYQVLANEMTNNHSGSVEINPDTSGDEITNWRSVDVGDFLQLIPGDRDECGGIERQIVLISGVKHKVDGGSWKIELQIQKWANPETATTLRYFSPDSKNYYNEDFEEIYVNGNE